MKTPLDKDLNNAYEAFNKDHEHLRQTLMASLPDRLPAKTIHIREFIGDTIMRSRITKLAAAAVIIIAVALSITFLDKSVTPAYAIEQTIKAIHAVRYFHVKYFEASHDDEPRECWLAFDERGQLKNVRIDFPKWMGGGGKVMVWKENVTQVWFKGKNSLTTFKDEMYTAKVMKFTKEYNPRGAIERLYDRQGQNEVRIQINEPSGKTDPIVITATHLPTSLEPEKREVFFVDQATKLVTSIEIYRLRDDEYEYHGVFEYYNYNMPIDSKIFTLDDEVPIDVKRSDWNIADIGLPQGDFTDNEISVKVVRDFLEAWINKNYAKAGKLFGGTSAAKMQERLGKLNIVRIVSIDEPSPHREPRSIRVPYTIEVQQDEGANKQKSGGFLVHRVYGQPNRWQIIGGTK